MAPHWLAPMLPSLPPILHNAGQNSTPSCSKGPRGLSVLPQLTSIFTRTSISPGLWLRQWGSRYAIRAGRNLPDKEFRYLRHCCYYSIDSTDDADSLIERPGHFCLAPRVATWIGLAHHAGLGRRAWRTVSEDPKYLLDWSTALLALAVHAVGKPHY
jgi:hypothetical protein